MKSRNQLNERLRKPCILETDPMQLLILIKRRQPKSSMIKQIISGDRGSPRQKKSLDKFKTINREAQRILQQQKLDLAKQRKESFQEIIKMNEQSLDQVPNSIANSGIKDKLIKVRKNIMSRIITNEIHEKTLSEWKLPELKRMATRNLEKDQEIRIN
ncbi:UNKNOWN [Stylonychia lemnae]|uniref:Uncharacterized protein n=1 Tax=Stylonychia lemnae TaxID=5949 RepID=A0A078A434_STYLE|nr:UNKNOWN [Stylonychia lemnae]|eukprot:CDW75524.1 UNKNOWN [Stylonychia lemnae]